MERLEEYPWKDKAKDKAKEEAQDEAQDEDDDVVEVVEKEKEKAKEHPLLTLLKSQSEVNGNLPTRRDFINFFVENKVLKQLHPDARKDADLVENVDKLDSVLLAFKRSTERKKRRGKQKNSAASEGVEYIKFFYIYQNIPHCPFYQKYTTIASQFVMEFAKKIAPEIVRNMSCHFVIVNDS